MRSREKRRLRRWVLGGLAFLGFVVGLGAVLRRAEGDPGTPSSLVFGAGVVFTAVWIASAAALSAVAYAVKLLGRARERSLCVEPDVSARSNQVGEGLFALRPPGQAS
jgi:hypothetical protein